MPNWCNNDLFIQGDKQSISKLKEELLITRDDELELTFNNVVPMPKGYEDTGEWYEWRYDNWGTKWDACDSYVSSNEDDEINIQFNTAWEPPIPFLYALANKYPDVYISCHFIEAGCEICGSFYSDAIGVRVQDEEIAFLDEYGDELIQENNGDDYVYKYKKSGEVYNDEDYYPFPQHPQFV